MKALRHLQRHQTATVRTLHVAKDVELHDVLPVSPGEKVDGGIGLRLVAHHTRASLRIGLHDHLFKPQGRCHRVIAQKRHLLVSKANQPGPVVQVLRRAHEFHHPVAAGGRTDKLLDVVFTVKTERRGLRSAMTNDRGSSVMDVAQRKDDARVQAACRVRRDDRMQAVGHTR